MERGLRTTGGTTVISSGPQLMPMVMDAPGGSTVYSGPTQTLPAGTYRVEIIRVDPKDQAGAPAQPAAKP
jgi:hypothetical protein